MYIFDYLCWDVNLWWYIRMEICFYVCSWMCIPQSVHALHFSKITYQQSFSCRVVSLSCILYPCFLDGGHPPSSMEILLQYAIPTYHSRMLEVIYVMKDLWLGLWRLVYSSPQWVPFVRYFSWLIQMLQILKEFSFSTWWIIMDFLK